MFPTQLRYLGQGPLIDPCGGKCVPQESLVEARAHPRRADASSQREPEATPPHAVGEGRNASIIFIGFCDAHVHDAGPSQEAGRPKLVCVCVCICVYV